MKPPAQLISGAEQTFTGIRRNRGFVADLLDQLDEVRTGQADVIRLQPGRHEIYASSLSRRTCFVSNHDSAERAVLFDLTDIDGVEIDGQGAELVFHGEVIPFFAERCRELKVSNLRIDWGRPFLSQGVVRDADAERLCLDMHEDHRFEVWGEHVVFVGEEYESDHLHNMLAFDSMRRETAFRARDHYGVMKDLRAKSIGKHRLELFGSFSYPAQEGEVMVIKHHSRSSPAFCFSHCRGVEVEDVTVHHAGGMAFVGQATRDIALRRCHVTPTPGTGRMFSSHADATHFTDCRGQIELTDCVFANQLDDATNVHGIYRRVDDRGTTNQLHCRLVHPQQNGVETVSAGDTVALFDDRDFSEIGRAEVVGVSHSDSRSAVYELKHAVPVREGHTVAMRWDHDIDVVIRGCEARGNRARGFLISTLGRVLIENNYFHVPGSAIQFNCDGNSWYESGPVEDVTIRDNVFDNCLHGVWGPALFSVRPEIEIENRTQTVNRNIAITDNRIVASDPRLINAFNVSGLRFEDNHIEWSAAYPHDHDGPLFAFHDSTSDVNCQPVSPPDRDLRPSNPKPDSLL